MERVYHLVSRSAWESQPDQDYRTDSLAIEGFIHCSFAAQAAWAANRFHTTTADLLVLEIDPARLISPLRVESAGTHGDFPHIFGPINPS
jgi:uncharacterized protein (DUF952 family)